MASFMHYDSTTNAEMILTRAVVKDMASQPGRPGSSACKRQKLLRKLPAGLWSILRPKKLARSQNILLGLHASRLLFETT
jgi:hypothetical protein